MSPSKDGFTSEGSQALLEENSREKSVFGVELSVPVMIVPPLQAFVDQVNDFTNNGERHDDAFARAEALGERKSYCGNVSRNSGCFGPMGSTKHI